MMQPDIPLFLYYSFLILCLTVLVLVTQEVRRRFPENRPYVYTIGAWFLIQYFGGKLGFFAGGIGELPPRIMIVVVPAFAVLFYFAFSNFGKKIAEQSDLFFMTWIQSFRFPLELILWQLAERQLLPTVMSFEGRNFDVVMGLSAPVMAFLYAKGVVGKREMIIWNIAGLVLVTNVVLHGILSVPGIEVISTNIPNFIVSFAPFNLLPGFLVMLAYLFHILSLKKLSKD